MPHIISDKEYRELVAYRETGLKPGEILNLLTRFHNERLKPGEDGFAPLPLPIYEDVHE